MTFDKDVFNYELMAAFEFDERDLDLTLCQFCNERGLWGPEDFGLNEYDLAMVENAINNVWASPSLQAIDKRVVVRFCLFKSINRDCGRKLNELIDIVHIAGEVAWRVSTGTGRFYRKQPSDKPLRGNLFEYLMSFCIEDVVTCLC